MMCKTSILEGGYDPATVRGAVLDGSSKVRTAFLREDVQVC